MQEIPLIAERIGDAEIVVMNKTPISRATLEKCPNVKMIAVLATGYNVVDLGGGQGAGHPRRATCPTTAGTPSVSLPLRCCWRSAMHIGHHERDRP